MNARTLETLWTCGCHATSSRLRRRRRRRRWSTVIGTVVSLAVLGTSACDEPSATGLERGRISASSVVTIDALSAQVSEGEVLWVLVRLDEPCWDAQASMNILLSWNADRFDYLPPPFRVGNAAVDEVDEGVARITVSGPHEAGTEIALSFRALADGDADGFVIEEASRRCSREGGRQTL